MALAQEDDSPTINALNFSMASDIVELVVLTGDEGVLQTMRDAVGSSRRLWHVLSADKVSDLLVAGEVGIVVIDVGCLRESAALFVSEITRQFPDLVVLVAGGRDTELELGALISNGTVYRFIHKPLSPNRARLFVEAAVRRYGERRRTLLTRAPEKRRPARAWPVLAVAGAALLALMVVLVLSLRGGPAREPALALEHPAAASTVLGQVTTRAAAALAANHLTSPAGENALELYLQASALSPADPAARAGLGQVRERLLARAENALLEERLDEAAAAIDTARHAGVDPSHIAFLSSQLAKAREQLKVARARTEAQKAADKPPVLSGKLAAEVAAAAATDKANTLAELAVERIAEGKLLEPEADNARYYVAEALRTDPNSDLAAEARQTLAARLLIEARSAIDRRDFARAADWLTKADGIALPVNIEADRALLDAARQQVQSDALAQLLKNATDRLREDRLIEPATDSAKYYLNTLRGIDPQHAGLAAAQTELGQKLLAKARLALSLQQYAAARSWLDEAVNAGVSGADVAVVARDLDTAANRQLSQADVLPASQLTQLKSVQPVYPPKARAEKLEGWVEVDFTVTEGGQVDGTQVHAASNPGVFDEAALRAVGQWRYQPVQRDGRAVAVHSRVRIRFTP